MSEIILSYEVLIRLGFFVVIFLLLALWESITTNSNFGFNLP